MEAHRAAARRAGALVQHDHPGVALAVLVRDEDLEAGVRLVAAGEGADRAEGGHARATEVTEGARVGAVLVAEGAAVASGRGAGARWPRCGHPSRPCGGRGPTWRRRGAVGGRRLGVVDGVGRLRRRALVAPHAVAAPPPARQNGSNEVHEWLGHLGRALVRRSRRRAAVRAPRAPGPEASYIGTFPDQVRQAGPRVLQDALRVLRADCDHALDRDASSLGEVRVDLHLRASGRGACRAAWAA